MDKARFFPAQTFESVIGPAYDQGRSRNCVGYVLAALVAFFSFPEPLQADAGTLYNLCKPKDGIREATGTFIRTGLDVLVSGVPTRERVPFSIKGYWPLVEVGQMIDHLVATGPFPLGLQVSTYGFREVDAHFPVIQKTGEFDGLHAMLVVGYDAGRQSFRVRNSYGVKWGEWGHAWLPYEYLATCQFNSWGIRP